MSLTSKNSDGSPALFLALIFWFASVGILVCGAGWADLMKDGWGPDAVGSHGLLAWQRFWAGFRGIFAVWFIPTFVLGSLSYWCAWQSQTALNGRAARS